jgi:c-di-GMP-binding flagellar brake protein YcgR
MNMLSRWLANARAKNTKKSLPESAARVYSQLYALKTARHFAWCSFGRDKMSYQSMIIAMNVNDRILVLDEPFGLPTSFFWSPGMPISVEIKDYATRISFTSRFIRLEPDGNEHRMMIAWPAEVDSHQRRSIFRVSFNGGEQVPMIQFVDLSPELFPCLDLSFHGVGVAIPDQLGEQMYVGQVLVVQLWLPGMDSIVGKLSIHRLSTIEDLGVMSLGAVIEGVDSASKRIIDRFLVAEQRRDIKQRAG